MAKSDQGIYDSDAMQDTLDSLRNAVDCLEGIEQTIAQGGEVSAEDRKFWTATRNYIKRFREISAEVVEKLPFEAFRNVEDKR